MTKYTQEEVSQLRQSPFILSVTQNSISYGPVFEHEYHRYIQLGLTPKEAFDQLGLDPEIVGTSAINSFHHRMKDYQPDATLTNESGSIMQTMMDMRKEIAQLRFENKFLKKKNLIDAGISPNVKPNDSTSK